MDANPPDVAELLRRADEGDRMALVRVYGHAAAWLRAGKFPPSPLGEWVGERLKELGVELGRASKEDGKRSIDGRVARILRVRRTAKGRRPSPKSENDERQLARDVLHLMANADRRPTEVDYQRVVDYHARPGSGTGIAPSRAQVKAAWLKFGRK